MANARDKQRRVELAAIHAGKKALGWDEASYRDALQQLTGKASAALLTGAERALVLDFMRTRGYARTGRSASYVPPKDDGLRPQLEKIRALWAELGQFEVLRDPTDAGLRGYVRRMANVEALEWLSVAQATTVIEGLKAWIARAYNNRDRHHA